MKKTDFIPQFLFCLCFLFSAQLNAGPGKGGYILMNNMIAHGQCSVLKSLITFQEERSSDLDLELFKSFLASNIEGFWREEDSIASIMKDCERINEYVQEHKVLLRKFDEQDFE